MMPHACTMTGISLEGMDLQLLRWQGPHQRPRTTLLLPPLPTRRLSHSATEVPPVPAHGMATALAALLDTGQPKCVDRFCGWPGERSMKKVGLPAPDESPAMGGWARLRDVHMRAASVITFAVHALSGAKKGLLLIAALEDGQIRLLHFHGEVIPPCAVPCCKPSAEISSLSLWCGHVHRILDARQADSPSVQALKDNSKPSSVDVLKESGDAVDVSAECLAMQPGGKHLMAVLSNGGVRMWNIEKQVRPCAHLRSMRGKCM